jgi:hypothetical protein
VEREGKIMGDNGSSLSKNLWRLGFGWNIKVWFFLVGRFSILRIKTTLEFAPKIVKPTFMGPFEKREPKEVW